MDFVRINAGKEKEAIYFYENNWKVFRDIAYERNYITSYKLLRVKPDSVGNFNLILMTEFADSTQFNLSEERFQFIIKELRPAGPKLLNDLKPKDFTKNVFFKEAETVFTSNNQ